MAFMESPLYRMELIIRRKPFDRFDIGALRRYREQRAALERGPIHVHDTATALARVAADVRTREAQAIAQELYEQCLRLDFDANRFTVDRQSQRYHSAVPGPNSHQASHASNITPTEINTSVR